MKKKMTFWRIASSKMKLIAPCMALRLVSSLPNRGAWTSLKPRAGWNMRDHN